MSFAQDTADGAHPRPPVIEPPADDAGGPEGLLRLVEREAERFRSRMLRHGALLFRGFTITGPEAFRAFVRAFSGKEFFGYAGGVSPRTGLGSGVYTSTEYPSDMVLTLHNEMSYTSPYPDHLYFLCVTPPSVGSVTTLGDSRRILERMPAEVVGEFRRKGVCYERSLSPHRGAGYAWQDAFETADPSEAEEMCRRKGMDFEWDENGYLLLRQVRPATARHPATGEEVWFNQAEGFHPSVMDRRTHDWFIENGEPFRLNSRFGDGSEIPLDMLESIRCVVREETAPHKWEKGDIIVLDNILTAHGRLAFSGERKIVLAMT